MVLAKTVTSLPPWALHTAGTRYAYRPWPSRRRSHCCHRKPFTAGTGYTYHVSPLVLAKTLASPPQYALHHQSGGCMRIAPGPREGGGITATVFSPREPGTRMYMLFTTGTGYTYHVSPLVLATSLPPYALWLTGIGIMVVGFTSPTSTPGLIVKCTMHPGTDYCYVCRDVFGPAQVARTRCLTNAWML